MRTRWPGGVTFVVSLFLVALAASVEGCDGAETGEAERTVADADFFATVTVLDPNFEAIFNPSWSMPARFLVFSPLVGLGVDGEIEPRLARSWEHSEDYREWSFHLRTDVRWHDGEPFTARDVAFTLRRMSHPEVAYRPPPDTVMVVDDSTVTVRRTRPWNGLDWWAVYYPEHLLGDVAPSEFFSADFWTRPVGTGPFRYVRHVPETVFVLEANPDYYQGEPSVDQVRIKFGGGSPVAELESGQVDIATYVTRAHVPRFREDPRFRIYYAMQPNLDWVEAIFWNQRHPFLADAAVRRALTMALDRRELHRVQYLPPELPQFPEGIPVFDVIPTGRQFWGGELPPPVPHDPDSARTLLAAAGWRDPDGDGLRTKGGQAARFTALVGGGGILSTSAFGRAAVYVQAALRNVGVRMEIRNLESGLMDRIRAGEFEAAFFRISRWNLADWFAENSPLGYHEPALARLFGGFDTLPDPGRRDSLYRESWPIVHRDLPFTFLGPQVQLFVAHRRLRGLESPFRAHPYIAASDLWIEEGEE